MVASPHEKTPSLGPYTEALAPSKNSTLFPIFSPLANAYSRFSGWRAALGLPNPGSVENLQKEVKSELSAVCTSVRGVSQGGTATHLNNFIFDGARADLMKGLSMDPAFQVTHSFQLASQSTPPTYSFGALFANAKVSYGNQLRDLSIFFLPFAYLQKVLLQGNVDHEGNVSGRFQQSWSASNSSKMHAQVCCHQCAPG